MKSLFLSVTIACLSITRLSVDARSPAPAIEFKENDTVVLLGDTFFERDYNYGHIETMLTTAARGKAGVRFRNLGWSGDTPRCESRSYFGPPQEGFDRLQKQLAEIKPTLVIACYGAVDAFKGEAGIPDFIAAYERQLDMIKTTGARVVLMSPPSVSSDTGRYPALAGHRAKLEKLRDAVRTLATSRSLGFADLLDATKGVRLTTLNGVTFTPEDYRVVVPAVARSLGLKLSEADLSSAQNNPSLTTAIYEKNRLFFHRWRPQNEIYLFGGRKHEQGNNGVEIPMFDPLIAEKEKTISAASSGK